MNKEKLTNISLVREIILVAVSVVIFGAIYWFTLPAIPGWGFMWTLLLSLVPGIFGIISAIENDEKSPVAIIQVGGVVLLIIFMLIAGIGGSAMFHSNTYAHTMDVVEATEAEAVEDMPMFEDVANISLMDTESAKKLGDRTLGGLSEYISQYDVSNSYTTISYNGRVVKVAPLEHAGIFKAMKNDTIPGYVIVDTITNEAEFVRVEEGIKYSPSAFFSKDLVRHIRSEFKTEILGDYYNFQVDENGNPYWAVTVMEYKAWLGAKTPTGTILVDAVTGDMEKYNLDEIPTWVDQVVDGDMVSKLYNRYGSLLNGAFNFSDTGKTQVTDDYGYVEKDGDIYIYTGVTSVAADESNIGFIMVNSRTGECKYYPVAGAEEYSAMSAAEGMVQNYGYEASFPSLVMYGNEPTYVMVLKDSNGLVKMYSMVNMKNYTIVAVGETLQDCQTSYIKIMSNAGNGADVSGTATNSEQVVISSIEFVVTGGETIVYVKDANGRVFKQAFAENENLILLNVGDEVEVKYSEIQTITPAVITK